MRRFPIPNVHSEIITEERQANPTFYAWIQAVHEQVGGNTGKLPGLEISKNGKIGFFGADPVERQQKINSPMGGDVIDTESRESIKQIITILKNLGLTE